MEEFSRQGGALDAARLRFPHAPEPWLDLSTGINPVPYPLGSIPPGAWCRLPETSAILQLEQAAAARYGVPKTADTVAAPGTQAIIQRLPALASGRDVRILGRTYGEFGRLFRDAGSCVREVPTAGALAGADMAVVVNPNNPDGRLVPVEDLLDVARWIGILVVDEAFADALPRSASVIPQLPQSRAIVLRSLGKFYGLAGLRLGFAVGSPDRMGALRRMLGPWPVSGPAISVGTKALGDAEWLAETHSRLEADGARLCRLLDLAAAKVLGATPLFVLVEHPAAARLFAALAERAILTRPFSGAPTWLRFGLPGSEAAWQRLEAALEAFDSAEGVRQA